MFDEARNFHKSYGQEGVGDCEFLNPRSVVSTLRGILYVASDNGIDALSDRGFFLWRFGSGVLGASWDVAVDEMAVDNREFFVANSSHHRVAVFNQKGDLMRTIGSTGSGRGQFQYPTAVAISRGELYVSDSQNHRVQVFTTQGVYIKEFGQGVLSYPSKLLFAGGIHLYIADRFNDCFAVFNRNGSWLVSIDCADQPVGLSLDDCMLEWQVCSSDWSCIFITLCSLK